MKVSRIEWDARNRGHFASHRERGISEVDVVATGDLVNGKTVATLTFGSGGFGQGQVTYAATFTDGSFAVATATPRTLVQPTITDPAPGAFVRGSHEFAADAPGATAVTFQVDSGASRSATLVSGTSWVLSPPFDSAALTDGPHSLIAQSVQALGEMSVTSFFVSDNTKPIVGIAALPPVVHGIITITATATDATSGIAKIAITVNTTSLSPCLSSTSCTVSFDTTTLLNGPFTVTATATDGAGNVSEVATATAQASNFNPAGFITSPAAGSVVKGSMTVAVNISDPTIASVECFVGGTSLGVSTSGTSSKSVSLLNQLDGVLVVSCTARDRAGNASTQSVTVTVKNWELNVHPNHVNLKSGGDKLNMSVRGTNATILLPIVNTLFLSAPGGTLVPALVAQPHVDGDMDCDDHQAGHVDVKFNRQAFIASVNVGIAAGKIDAKKQILIQFLSGTHLLGTDNVTVKQ